MTLLPTFENLAFHVLFQQSILDNWRHSLDPHLQVQHLEQHQTILVVWIILYSITMLGNMQRISFDFWKVFCRLCSMSFPNQSWPVWFRKNAAFIGWNNEWMRTLMYVTFAGIIHCLFTSVQMCHFVSETKQKLLSFLREICWQKVWDKSIISATQSIIDKCRIKCWFKSLTTATLRWKQNCRKNLFRKKINLRWKRRMRKSRDNSILSF